MLGATIQDHVRFFVWLYTEIWKGRPFNAYKFGSGIGITKTFMPRLYINIYKFGVILIWYDRAFIIVKSNLNISIAKRELSKLNCWKSWRGNVLQSKSSLKVNVTITASSKTVSNYISSSNLTQALSQDKHLHVVLSAKNPGISHVILQVFS